MAHLVCFSSLRNHCLVLPEIQYLKTIFHIFCLGFWLVQLGEYILCLLLFSLPEVEVKHLLFVAYFILIRATVMPKYVTSCGLGTDQTEQMDVGINQTCVHTRVYQLKVSPV